ncbi:MULTISPECIES: hypothetical protein [Actinomadura]|uniref:Uncharacterized protein n=1 Tax=Actinomadura yumaensis TaxID=111807 RepID=A0ABW2CMD1_9ACTN|nr:hypothetical protein [Actinomadura sp. J1-007]MWK36526.1 hypothetical protein [Actinomadura sp. J1-007]
MHSTVERERRAVTGTGTGRAARNDRPVAVRSAVAVLCAAWGSTAVLTFALLSSTRERTWPLRALDAVVPGPAGPQDAAPGGAASAGVCAVLLATGALLVYAVPELLQGHRAARTVVWTATPLLAAEPVRRALGMLDGDATVAWCVLAVAACALLAAALLALPSASAHLRR